MKEVRKLIREAKTSHYNFEFSKHNKDIKKTWKTIADVMNKSRIQNEFASYFNINGIKVNDTKEIVTHFNNFFINIGPRLAESIDTNGKPDFDFYLHKKEVQCTFNFTPIDEEQVKTIIERLKPKKSAGNDNIPVILLKASVSTISKPLTSIINESFSTGKFPNKLKIAKIIPIFKKEDEHDLNNYRPISILPAISKVFEKVVYTQLFQYFTNNTCTLINMDLELNIQPS